MPLKISATPDTIRIANLRDGWTQDKPTIPGWYWTMAGLAVVCVYVCERYHYRDKEHKVVEATVNEFTMSTKDYDWWIGPLEEPVPPPALKVKGD